MAEKTRNLCAEIPLELHTKVRQRQAESGETLSRYMTALITKFYEMEERQTMEKEVTRPVCVQVPVELFEQFKTYLKQHGMTQKDFVIRCIQQALAEEQDVKRLLAIYYRQDLTTEVFRDFDGEEYVHG